MKSIKKSLILLILGLLVFLFQNCTPFELAEFGSSSSEVNFFVGLNQKVIEPKCLDCHSGVGASGGLNLSSYSEIMSSGIVVAGNAATSSLYTTLLNPLNEVHNTLTEQELIGLADWINNGAIENEIPIVVLGPDRNIQLPTSTIQIEGQTSDIDGQIVTYLWQQTNGPTTATLTNAGTRILTASSLAAGSYTFRLTVTDNSGATNFDLVQVAVSLAANINPVVEAGTNKAITLPVSSVTINATASDSDGTITNIIWTQTSGPSTATLSGQTTLALTASSLIEGTYLFNIEVTDNRGGISSDSVSVVVSPQPPNQLPVVDAGPLQSITLPVSTVTITATASDPDGTITTLLWTQTSGPNSATFTGQTTLSLTASGLVAGTYVFNIEVTDNRGGKRQDVATVVVSPQPINQLPTVNAGADKTITLPSNTTSFTSTASDPDGTIASYLWTQVSGPSAATLSGATTNRLQANNLIQGTYVFNVRVTDNSGGQANDTASVLVNPAPPPPTFSQLNSDIFVPLCVGCHGSVNPNGGYSMTNYNNIKTRVINNDAANSELYQRIIDDSMPPGSPLNQTNKNRIRDWINSGALNN